MGQTNNLTVADWRDLYEGMTQADDIFREKMAEKVPGISTDNILSELELSQNRLTYAMMGIYPIYWREIELSGIVNYPDQTLALYADNGERILSFEELDPSYIEFLENQKRIRNTKDVQPLSSVALHASEELYPEMKKYIDPIPMNTDGTEKKLSSNMLRIAWARSTILMNHIQEELERYGVDKAFAVSRDDLRAYCTSNIGNAQFDRSIAELSNVAAKAEDMDNILHQA